LKKNILETKLTYPDSLDKEVIMKEKVEAVEVKCPKCGRTQIIYLPKETLPKCPDCNVRMIISELLDEGKSY
jgi:ribosomal protein S27E